MPSCTPASDFEVLGASVTSLPVDGQGLVNPDDVRSALRPNTKLISVMMANNETGVIQPLEEIGRIAAETDVWFHTDAVQAAGKIPIDVNRLRCDLLTISGHKLHAPQGIGVPYVRRGTTLQPMFYGGPQERGRRAGTENLAGIVGLGKAAELAVEWLQDGRADKMAALRDRFERTITERLESTHINGGQAPRVPNTTNICFECVAGGSLVVGLDRKGISVSTGSACTAGSGEPPYVLVAMGIPSEQAHASVRFSLGKQTTEGDVDFALEQVCEAVLKLREVSPLWERRNSSSTSEVTA